MCIKEGNCFIRGRYNKKGQVTIFIIVAIVIIGAVVGYFVLRDRISIGGIPANIEPVYASFLSCVEDYTLVGISVLESQAGYIELPDFEAGSSYMPFSSQLNFLGSPVPYWYYVSGNNVQKEQVPSRTDMENQLGDFIKERVNNCVFDEYYEQGFDITFSDLASSKADVNIRDNQVEVDLGVSLSINFEEDSVLINDHEVIVKSDLGNLYNSAKNIYNYEQEELFLENYAVDILRLYAPVDGVELTCAPKTWGANKIFDDLQEAIEENTLALKIKGGDYSLKTEENKYFVVDVDIDSGVDVRFFNSKEWANSFEVEPSQESMLISKPVGNQPGLGIIGFCYVPYHFVYGMKYPVLVQVYSGEEIFQFPLAVVVQGNKPRESLDVSAVDIPKPQLCEYKNTFVNVNTYDAKLNLVEANISYKCFNEVCSIGETEFGNLAGMFPQCVNGYIIAETEGFQTAEYFTGNLTTSSSEEGSRSVDIILTRFYELDVDLKLDSKSYSKNALISFVSNETSSTIAYPEQKSVKLAEGQYEVQVYVYRNSSLRLEKTNYEQCMDIPQSGIGGFFGLSEEKCFDIEIPEQIISNALSGGGKENYYILESELEIADFIEINVGSLPTPRSIEQLQDNYVLFESKGLGVSFK